MAGRGNLCQCEIGQREVVGAKPNGFWMAGSPRGSSKAKNADAEPVILVIKTFYK